VGGKEGYLSLILFFAFEGGVCLAGIVVGSKYKFCEVPLAYTCLLYSILLLVLKMSFVARSRDVSTSQPILPASGVSVKWINTTQSDLRPMSKINKNVIASAI
jgi:hypothetical protein